MTRFESASISKGGFTDTVTIRNGVVHITKTESTPETPERGMFKGLETALAGEGPDTETDNRARLVGKVVYNFAPRTVISVHIPGMGRYGNPDGQNPKAVVHNVQLEKISPMTARVAYSFTNPNLDDSSDTEDVTREGSDPN